MKDKINIFVESILANQRLTDKYLYRADEDEIGKALATHSRITASNVSTYLKLMSEGIGVETSQTPDLKLKFVG